jgi:hypothetical protein
VHVKSTIRIGTAIATLAALAVLGLSVASASAESPMKVTAVTHTSNHPDTTSVTGTCTGTSSNGPVWAYDNLSLRITVTPGTGPEDYAVTVTAHGSFAAIADPNTGDCYTGRGGVDGWYQLDVTSSTAPDPANLPSHVPSDETQGAIVNQLFGGSATVAGGHYSYTYTLVDGQKYTQTG